MPVSWAGLLLFHPTGEGNVVYPVISEQLGRQHEVGAALVEDVFMHSPVFELFENSGSLTLAGGIITTAIGPRHARGIGRESLWLLVPASVLITVHVPPFGPVGLTFFVLAVLLGRHQLLRR